MPTTTAVNAINIKIEVPKPSRASTSSDAPPEKRFDDVLKDQSKPATPCEKSDGASQSTRPASSKKTSRHRKPSSSDTTNEPTTDPASAQAAQKPDTSDVQTYDDDSSASESSVVRELDLAEAVHDPSGVQVDPGHVAEAAAATLTTTTDAANANQVHTDQQPATDPSAKPSQAVSKAAVIPTDDKTPATDESEIANELPIEQAAAEAAQKQPTQQDTERADQPINTTQEQTEPKIATLKPATLRAKASDADKSPAAADRTTQRASAQAVHPDASPVGDDSSSRQLNFADLLDAPEDRPSPDSAFESSKADSNAPAFAGVGAAAALTTPAAPHGASHVAPASAAAPTPEAQFAAENHPHIVTSIRSNLLPNGGSMQIRLDPPQLGPLQLDVRMRDGVMSAAFVTSSSEASHLVSHSLSDLRSALEASGIVVDKLHVEQAPRNHSSQNDNPDSRQQQQSQSHDSPARREQERRELLQRMWRKLSQGSDPLDMVA